jgi:hypothetical protein
MPPTHLLLPVLSRPMGILGTHSFSRKPLGRRGLSPLGGRHALIDERDVLSSLAVLALFFAPAPGIAEKPDAGWGRLC